jgi:aryl-alcohol dehydrogenase-like predicted oxidoreductase
MPTPDRIQLTEDYSISRIIVGGWQFSPGHGAHGALGTDPVELFTRLVELGFTTFDCADIYQGVEEFIGGVLRKSRGAGGRSGIQVHTKFVPDLDILPTINKAYVERIIHRSLSRLGVEQLDLLQFHWWDFKVPAYQDVAHWLKELQEEGKIRHLGVTNFDRSHLDELVSAGIPIVSNQVQYSVLDRRPGQELTGYCKDRGISLLCYGALAGGFLTDRFLGSDDPPAEPENRSLTKYRLIIAELGGWGVYQSILNALGEIARRHEAPLPSVALRWVLDREAVGATITGIDSVEQAHGLRKVFHLELDEKDRNILDPAMAKATGPAGPVYGFERVMDGPHGRIMRYNLNQE